jgi:hypothetical protein
VGGRKELHLIRLVEERVDAEIPRLQENACIEHFLMFILSLSW